MPLGLAIALGGVAIVGAMGAGAWWWWQQNAEHLTEAAKTAYLQGQRDGARLDENGCVVGAVARHSVEENQTILESVRTSVILRGCLETSKADVKFCAEVPKKDEIVSFATWSAQHCAKQGLTDSYCSHLMGQISEYCSSQDRASKL